VNGSPGSFLWLLKASLWYNQGMVKRIVQCLSLCPPGIYFFLYFVIVAYFTFINGLQGDTLFHLKIGEYIGVNGIPLKDPFSWTTYGKSWFAHEWLWDLMIYQLYSWMGYIGIFVLQFFSIGLIGFCSFLLIKDRLMHFLCFILLLNTSLTIGFFSLRPQTFVYGLFALLLYLVSKREKSRKIHYGIPFFLLFLFWANIHSSVIFAVGILMIFFIFKKIPLSDIFLAVLGSLMNPNGWRLYIYASVVGNSSKTVDRITEWFSPDFHYLPTLFIFLFILLFLVITTINLVKNKRIILHLFLFFITISLYLKSFRHLPFLLIMALYAGVDTHKINKGIQMIVIITIMAVSLFSAAPFTMEKLSKPDLSTDFPVKAVAFMKKNGYTDHIMNDYYYGDYLIYVDIKTFVDGRGDLFVMENPVLWEDYFDFTGLKTEKPEEILKKYNIKYVLFPKKNSCIKYLRQLTSIEVLYEDSKDIVLRFTNE